MMMVVGLWCSECLYEWLCEWWCVCDEYDGVCVWLLLYGGVSDGVFDVVCDVLSDVVCDDVNGE